MNLPLVVGFPIELSSSCHIVLLVSRQLDLCPHKLKNIADELWQKLQHLLHAEQLSYKDFPLTEELLWGTLKELGFHSYLDRAKLSKQIACKLQEEASQEHPIDITAALVSNRLTSANADGLLSVPGSRGLAAACRSACAMALTACQTTEDAGLWLQMPRTVSTIGATMQAYEIMQEARKKHPDKCSCAQEASIALRDVLTLLIMDAYAIFDEALADIATTFKIPKQNMPELRSQVYLSRTSITRLVQRTSAIEGEVLKIYKVPLTQHEIADILAAYSECAQRTTLKRKTIRLPKNSKNNDTKNAGNTVEIV